METWLQWIYLQTTNILRTLRIMEDRRIRLRVVVLGGPVADLGMAQSAAKDAQRWWRDKADVIWQYRWEHRTGVNPAEPGLRAYHAQNGDPVPCLYVLTYLHTTPEGWRGAYNGQLAWVGRQPSGRLIAHELGHVLSLRHTDTGLMRSAATDGQLSNATLSQAEIDQARQEARLYRRGS